MQKILSVISENCEAVVYRDSDSWVVAVSLQPDNITYYNFSHFVDAKRFAHTITSSDVVVFPDSWGFWVQLPLFPVNDPAVVLGEWC